MLEWPETTYIDSVRLLSYAGVVLRQLTVSPRDAVGAGHGVSACGLSFSSDAARLVAGGFAAHADAASGHQTLLAILTLKLERICATSPREAGAHGSHFGPKPCKPASKPLHSARAMFQA